MRALVARDLAARRGSGRDGSPAGPRPSYCERRRSKLLPPLHLRVLGIPDLQPRRGAAVGSIRATRPLRDDAFEVPLTRDAIQIHAPPFDMLAGASRCAA
jgi:hypothetical protein